MAEENAEMRKRPITMPDGRYLIFYTFGDEDKPKESSAAENNLTQPETSEGEHHV